MNAATEKESNENQYFKLVKISQPGDKIGYYNSNIDPESSWPTKDVDLAQILSTIEVKGIMTLENIKKKHFKLDYTIQKILVYEKFQELKKCPTCDEKLSFMEVNYE